MLLYLFELSYSLWQPPAAIIRYCLIWKKKEENSLQHPDFPSGHPPPVYSIVMVGFSFYLVFGVV